MVGDIGLGVIGLGMGRDLFYLNQDPFTRFQVRGICAKTASKVEQAAKQHGIPRFTTDYRDLVRQDEISAIAVFSPDHLHGEHCLAALRAGKHVLVTKPMVTRLSEADVDAFTKLAVPLWYNWANKDETAARVFKIQLDYMMSGSLGYVTPDMIKGQKLKYT